MGSPVSQIGKFAFSLDHENLVPPCLWLVCIVLKTWDQWKLVTG